MVTAAADPVRAAGVAPVELRNADIVMKGGITSGVVYPGAVWELAQAFRFRSIGGTSAGAIAAAATAAAEHGRQSRVGSGFAGLRDLPDWLAADEGRLIGFFRPQPETAALFRDATAFVGASRGRARRVAKAAIGAFPIPLLLGLLPAVALAASAGAGGWIPVWAPLLTAAALAALATALILRPEPKSGPEPSAPVGQAPSKVPVSALAIGLLAAPVALAALALADRRGGVGHVAMGLILMLALAFIALVVPLAAVVATFVTRLLRTLPRNLFGLCTGNGPTGDASRPALTPWLADFLDGMAGVPSDGPARRPLTFGDLDRHKITLQTMTSNLTSARGFRLPFEDDGREHWHFDPAEFRRLFPAYVVDWMASPERHPSSGAARPDGKLPLPRRADFPVVVAARMSLSFPFLLSAVPLHTHRGVRSRPPTGAEPAREPQPLVRCWFSDGGLVSNFPLHFFDSPLPRWPTFAINLRGFPAGGRPAKDPCDNIYLVDSDTGDTHEDWTEITGLPGFAGSLKCVMENSHDNEQILLVGFRDRIAHVRLADDEGGLNLRMPPGRVKALSARGACAGEALQERFTAPPQAELSWANHRWVRYRITMANLQDFLERFAKGYGYCAQKGVDPGCPPDEPSYAEMIRRAKGTAPERFFWAPREQKFAEEATDALIAMAERWSNEQVDLDDGALRPHSELRNVPRA